MASIFDAHSVVVIIVIVTPPIGTAASLGRCTAAINKIIDVVLGGWWLAGRPCEWVPPFCVAGTSVAILHSITAHGRTVLMWSCACTCGHVHRRIWSCSIHG